MQELLLIALGILLFFGGKKIPEMMNGLGKGVRSFKEGMNDIKKDIEEEPTKESEERRVKSEESSEKKEEEKKD